MASSIENHIAIPFSDCLDYRFHKLNSFIYNEEHEGNVKDLIHNSFEHGRIFFEGIYNHAKINAELFRYSETAGKEGTGVKISVQSDNGANIQKIYNDMEKALLMTVRYSSDRDIEQILTLNNEHGNGLSKKDGSFFEKYLNTQNLIVADYHNKVAGFALCFKKDDDYDDKAFNFSKTIFFNFNYVDRIVVNPNMRGRGLARDINNLLIELKKDKRLIALSKDIPENVEIKDLCNKLGFNDLGSVEVSSLGKHTVFFRE